MLPKPYLGSRFVVSCPVSDVNKLRVKGGHAKHKAKLCVTAFTESNPLSLKFSAVYTIM